VKAHKIRQGRLDHLYADTGGNIQQWRVALRKTKIKHTKHVQVRTPIHINDYTACDKCTDQYKKEWSNYNGLVINLIIINNKCIFRTSQLFKGWGDAEKWAENECDRSAWLDGVVGNFYKENDPIGFQMIHVILLHEIRLNLNE